MLGWLLSLLLVLVVLLVVLHIAALYFCFMA
jgi:hypothetical protein